MALKHLLSLIIAGLLLSCSQSPVIDRAPDSVVGDQINKMDYYNAKAAIAWSPEREKLGATKPWEFTGGHYYCGLNEPKLESAEFKNLTPAQLENQHDGLVEKWVRAVNIRTHHKLSCDDKFEKITQEIFESVHKPYYRVGRKVNDQKEVVFNGFTVGSYESMIFQNVSVAQVASLAQRPKFENPERKSAATVTNKPILNDDGETILGNIKVTSTNVSSMFCVHRIQNMINKETLEELLTLCSAYVGAVPVMIGPDLYIVYTDISYADDLSKALVETRPFSVKLHKAVFDKLPVLENQDAYFKKMASDITLFQVTDSTVNAKDAGATEIAVPLNMIGRYDDRSQSLQLAMTYLSRGAQRLKYYEISGADFKNKTETVIPVQKTANLQLSTFAKDAFVFSKGTQDGGRRIYAFDLASRQVRETEKIPEGLDVRSPVITRLLYYTTNDGRKLPIVVRYKPGFKEFDKNNFGIAEVYGGFNVVTNAGFKSVDPSIFNRGGFTAHVTVRGGGELGPKEWRESYGINKRTPVDDFNAAAEFLYKNGFAGPRRLVSEGWSNGGLMVLMAAARRPELYGAVVAGSPVTDVVNTIKTDPPAKYWMSSDYGFIDDKNVGDFWRTNSPVSTLPKLKDPPAILLRTAFDDLNVNPSHSFKLFMALNERPDKDKFSLFVQPTGSGHGPSTLQAQIEEYSYIFSFISRALNLK